MGRIIVCNRTACKYNHCKCCDLDIIEIDDSGCASYTEIDVYKEVEGFSRDEQNREAY